VTSSVFVLEAAICETFLDDALCRVLMELTSCVCHRKQLAVCFQI